MDFAGALRRLDARTNTEASGALVAPTLRRMEALSDLLSSPEKSYPALHITGTNGKTSTARVATVLLKAAGLAVGTYTSPHLHTVLERIAYDGGSIDEASFVETVAYLEPFLDQVDAGDLGRVTWFETLTAMAEVWFAERAVDVAVVEVGMGGEWDATNLVDGRVAVITEVAVDHPELGSTPVEVAGEKAGIVKAGAVCLTGERDPQVLGVIARRCDTVGAELRRVEVDFELEHRALAVGGQTLDVRIGGRVLRELFLPLYGESLATDALLGLASVSAFLGDRPLAEDLVRDALARVRSPGRLEVVGRRPLVVVDGAHNPDAALALSVSLAESFQWSRLWVIVGVLAPHSVEGVLEPLLGIADEVIATRSRSPRAVACERIAEEVERAGKKPILVRTVADAITIALERAEESDAILVTGSLYTVAEARSRLLEGML